MFQLTEAIVGGHRAPLQRPEQPVEGRTRQERRLSGQGRKFDDVCCAQFGLGRGARCFRTGTRASPASGAVTDERRSPRPNSAQPFGRRFFSAQAALLAPCLGRKLLAANVTEFRPLTTKCASSGGEGICCAIQELGRSSTPLRRPDETPPKPFRVSDQYFCSRQSSTVILRAFIHPACPSKNMRLGPWPCRAAATRRSPLNRAVGEVEGYGK